MEICEGDSIKIGDIYYSESGTYYDSLKTIKGCDSIIATQLQVNPLPELDMGNDTSICAGKSITIGPSQTYMQYDWSTGQDQQTLLVFILLKLPVITEA